MPPVREPQRALAVGIPQKPPSSPDWRALPGRGSSNATLPPGALRKRLYQRSAGSLPPPEERPSVKTAARSCCLLRSCRSASAGAEAGRRGLCAASAGEQKSPRRPRSVLLVRNLSTLLRRNETPAFTKFRASRSVRCRPSGLPLPPESGSKQSAGTRWRCGDLPWVESRLSPIAGLASVRAESGFCPCRRSRGRLRGDRLKRRNSRARAPAIRRATAAGSHGKEKSQACAWLGDNQKCDRKNLGRFLGLGRESSTSVPPAGSALRRLNHVADRRWRSR
jgi:hypothetical protein